MAEDRDNLIMSSILRNALRARLGKPNSPCPDGNLIAAFLEDHLNPAERKALEEHAADCARCQELLSVSIALEAPAEHLEVSRAEGSSYGSLLFRFSFPVSSLALLIVAGIAIYVFLESRPDSNREPTREFAHLEQPAIQPGADVPGQARVESGARDVKSLPEAANQRERALDPEAAGLSPPTRSDFADRAVESNLPAPRKPADEDRESEAIGGRAEAADHELRLKKSAEKERMELRLTEDFGGRDNARQSKVESAGLSGAPPSPATAPAAELTPQQVLTALSEVPAGSEGSDKAGKLDAPAAFRTGTLSRPSETRLQSTQSVGSKTFVRLSNYWVDLQCREHAQEEVIELAADDERLAEIQRGLPQLERLRSSKLPVLIRWRDKNYVIR